MAEFNVNKGIGRSPEFKGLKSQYLFIFAGGLLALFVIFVVMYMAGIDQWVCIGFGVVSASVLVWVTFRMNSKYGEWGLMKLHALRSHPRYIISRRKSVSYTHLDVYKRQSFLPFPFDKVGFFKLVGKHNNPLAQHYQVYGCLLYTSYQKGSFDFTCTVFHAIAD